MAREKSVCIIGGAGLSQNERSFRGVYRTALRSVTTEEGPGVSNSKKIA